MRLARVGRRRSTAPPPAAAHRGVVGFSSAHGASAGAADRCSRSLKPRQARAHGEHEHEAPGQQLPMVWRRAAAYQYQPRLRHPTQRTSQRSSTVRRLWISTDQLGRGGVERINRRVHRPRLPVLAHVARAPNDHHQYPQRCRAAPARRERQRHMQQDRQLRQPEQRWTGHLPPARGRCARPTPASPWPNRDPRAAHGPAHAWRQR